MLLQHDEFEPENGHVEKAIPRTNTYSNSKGPARAAEGRQRRLPNYFNNPNQEEPETKNIPKKSANIPANRVGSK